MVPIQFITHHTDTVDYETSALLALDGGCKWIQLRMKGASDDEVEPVALRLQKACRKAEATFVLDDRVDLALKIKADGVHLGKEDMPVMEAREKLGHEFLIGGTANTLDDVVRLKREGADYVGCGPMRFTTTKERLAPVIGLDGYAEIMRELRRREVKIPVAAIGGITVDDVLPLLDCGVHGIAVSGAVLTAPDPVAMMRRFLEADEDL